MISESDGSLRTRDVQDRRLSIIDVSSADDSLLDPFSGSTTLNHQHSENQENGELWYTPNSKKFEDAASKIEQWEQEPHTSETTKTKKNTKCNLRKSLAWDSAFFTSAGVLDAEELSSIIEGVEKEALPRIEEDVYKSCDSISTLESDSLTLESVEMEGDLFEDVRASIQKSSKKSNLSGENTKVPSPVSGLQGFQTRDPSRKVGMVSRDNMKAPPASKNQSPSMRGIGKMTNKNNPIFTRLPQPVTTRRESSISKQSKVPGKPSASSTISSKRVSLGNLHVKSEKDKAKQIIGDKVSSVSKAYVIGGSRGTKHALSSKLTSGPSVSTKTKSAASISSGSNLSDNNGKSSFNTSKRRVNAGTSKPPSSCSAARTPSRLASRNNTKSGNSSLSGSMSATRLSSSISPASSVSDLSSESSFSTSMPKHTCNSSRSSVDSSCSGKVLSDTNADQGINSQNPQSDQSIEGQEAEAQHTGFMSQSGRTASVATVIPPAPAKPSGLRLPSPKIGFFDGMKPSVRTPRGGMQPHSVVPHGLPKHGASPSEGQNKAKPGKLQPARSITSIENKKPNNQQNSHPDHFHESLDVAIKTSSQVQDVKSSSDMPMGAVENVEDTSPSHRVEKTHYILHPLSGVNNRENVSHDNQVDCLSKQIGLMDINSKTFGKINGDSLSFFQTDVSFQDKSNGLELSSHKELFDYPKSEESLKGSFTPNLSVSPTSFDSAISRRIPFAAKDSLCNMDCSDVRESALSEVKPTNLSLPESITKENS